ncbi:MAG: 5'/3'-nucleotidase SurE [Microthrixaceae bacterium]
MLALITNDDGITSEGIRTLAMTAELAGLEVLVAAPSWDSSGASASLTSVEQGGRFLVAEASIDGVDGRCLSLEAAPAFITRAALHGSFGPPPDVVLSGINHGLNCGYSILHSGTVGAATTAFTYGTPSIAFSIDTMRPSDETDTNVGSPPIQWDTAKVIVGTVLDWFCEQEPMILLNVNVPNIATHAINGLSPATLAQFGAVTANVTEIGKGYVSMEYRSQDATPEPGTDFALIAEGFASYTALQPVCQSSSADMTALSNLTLST